MARAAEEVAEEDRYDELDDFEEQEWEDEEEEEDDDYKPAYRPKASAAANASLMGLRYSCSKVLSLENKVQYFHS